jgi:hypothetical protein
LVELAGGVEVKGWGFMGFGGRGTVPVGRERIEFCLNIPFSSIAHRYVSWGIQWTGNILTVSGAASITRNVRAGLRVPSWRARSSALLRGTQRPERNSSSRELTSSGCSCWIQ